MRTYFCFILIVIGLSGCSPKITSSVTAAHTPLAKDAEVLVLEIDAPMPENAEMLGQIKIGDTGFTTKNSNYAAVLNIAKDQARQAGGNVVKITEHKSPDLFSSIHRIKADILRVDDLSVLSDDMSDMEVSTHPDYAVIYFYRESGAGALVSYDVYVGDTKVYRSRPDTKAEVKLYEDGDVEVWAKTEAKEVLPLTVRKGRDYYIRTSVSPGIMIGRPDLEILSSEAGRVEYESIKDK
jgi:hypothetical protein